MEWVNGQLDWKSLFLRDAQVWEIKSLEHILNELYAVKVTHMRGDGLVWLPSPKKGFQVNNFIKRFMKRMQDPHHFLGSAFGKQETHLELPSSYRLQH
jgi:hypothetical protein